MTSRKRGKISLWLFAVCLTVTMIGGGIGNAFVASAYAGNTSTAITNVRLNTDKPAQFAKLEATFNLGTTYSNPFDPEEVDAVAEITTPSGIIETVPAFYASPSSPSWTVRYSPRQQGKHELIIAVKDKNGISRSGTIKFNAKKPDAGRGFMNVSGDRFVDSYGKQITLLGTNYAWGNPPETLAAMPEYRNAGMNLMRVWLTAWWANYSPEYGPVTTTQNGITMTYDGIGKYNLDNMTRMDTLIETAKDNDLYIMLTLNSFGDFWYDWAYHAYNRDNGGTSQWKENQTDFWYNPEAIDYQKKLLRYVFARWGYSTSLGMLEYWNESDNRVDTTAEIRDSWHATLDEYWKSWDFYKHPTTTSFAWKDHVEQHATQDSWDGLESLDAVNMHLYAADSDITGLWEASLNALRTFGNRPVFIGEAGKTGNDISTDDSLLNYVHDGVWGPVFRSGAAGANVWWIFENGFNMPPAYKEQYANLARFIQPEEENLVNMGFKDYGTQSNGTKVGAFQDQTGAIGWINDPAYTYDAENGRAVSGMLFSVTGLQAGKYQVSFYNTYTGTTISTTSITSGSQGLTMAIPSFSRDIAFKAVLTEKSKKDKTDPSAPSQLASTVITEHTIKLTWNASSDNVAVTGYDIYRNGKRISVVSGLANSYRDVALQPGTPYQYMIKAHDAGGNESGGSTIVAATNPSDTFQPTSPLDLAVTDTGINTIDLGWSSSYDNTGVTGYLIYRDSVLIGRSTETTFQDRDLRPGTAYTYTIKATDKALNASAASDAVIVTTESPTMTDNLVLNPGFETIANGMPMGWTCEQSQYCASDTTEKKSGEASLRISGTTGAWFGVVSAAVPASAGNTYLMDSFANISVNNGSTVKVRMQFMNAADSILDDKTVKVYNGTTSGYDNIYGSFTAPSGTAKVRVYLYIEGLNTVINLDDFSIKGYGDGVVTPEEPSANLLLNPGFDDHNDSWKTAIWTCEKEWLCQWTDQVKRSGMAAMRVNPSNPDWFSVYQDALVTPGQSYTLDGFVQLSKQGTGGKLQVKLIFYNAAGEQLTEEWLKDYDGTTSGFENVHGTKAAPANAAKARVQLYVNGLAGEMYFDDFSLSES
ncbi:DUF5060 domain-containing protein [Paenibacillus glycanilyticus]|uniref:fibronectin type III domain-containing protein n=1 Tax=Paenibacillus glycanilyticus TaxID=126569 RepID=UPI00203A9EA9|nr:fibronectin type III domain-containing protein [Paenibacillus glycanilyticus]MCM3628297.1 DUF5060 domain-containing protein [Paenibacillus glycanilyticus]